MVRRFTARHNDQASVHLSRRHTTTILPFPFTTDSQSTPNPTVEPSTQTGVKPSPSLTSPAGVNSNPSPALTTFTTSVPITITQQSTIITTFSQTVTTFAMPSTTGLSTTSSEPSITTFNPANAIQGNAHTVCIGDGFDAASLGLLSALVVPSLIGLLLWIVFAIVRPRFRQIYGLREWFVQQDLRPRPLGPSFWAFLFPHVPMVPSVTKDVSDVNQSAVRDAELFPSDEQLSQRALWVAFLIVCGWTIIGLAGALPLYLVSTPCIGSSTPPASTRYGYYSTLQDLSLLRLLRAIDHNSEGQLQSRAVVDGKDVPRKLRIRIIVLTILTIVVAILPALRKIIKELDRTIGYRNRWISYRCAGMEMGWLSARKAPGLVGWGEKHLKDFFLKNGLSSSAAMREPRGNRRLRRQPTESDMAFGDDGNSEIDVQQLFSISDTQNLAILIDERDEILENLEIAETRYISSFRMTTPDPSIADYQPPPLPEDPSRPYISRPMALAPVTRRRNRAVNRAFGGSSLAPTSFVAPSSYYKLRGVDGVSGGRFTELGEDTDVTLGDSFRSRVIGSRFLEVNRNSEAFGRLPMGSRVMVEKSGQFTPASPPPSTIYNIPDPALYGPNCSLDLNRYFDEGEGNEPEDEQGILGDEWVDLTDEMRVNDFNGMPPTPKRRPRPPPPDPSSSTPQRETFPLRAGEQVNLNPPHLRLQPRQPFVRPLSGINFEDLGAVYADISHWRSRLKVINLEIAEAQREGYNDIAGGVRIKGWLMIGRGLRFLPGIELIEGRAKEDIRWDVLQNERTGVDRVVFWSIVFLVVVLLFFGLTAAAGLAVGTAPDVAYHVPFLRELARHNNLVTGLATVFAPALGATLFIYLSIATIGWAINIRGHISISGGQLIMFKTTFLILTVVAGIWITAAGSLIFSVQAFSSDAKHSRSLANGSIYISSLAASMVVTVALIAPALLVLQPFHLWHVLRNEKQAVTPRQRFRAVYPRTYNPSFATGACILGIVFASTFSLIFPLIGPAVVILLFLTLIAHRYLVGYVYARTHSQTGGLLQIWLFRRFGTLLSFQPLLLGLILLSRGFWIEGGVLCGTAFAIIVFVESYASWRTRQPGRSSLSPITRDSLDKFVERSKPSKRGEDEESTSLVSPGRVTRHTRGSMASVLEMMSVTLAVMPSPTPSRGPVPLATETLNDLTATERAARTHPDAPPHLPPLSFTDHAEEMSGILYAPELIAPPPIIWLPKDSAGIARSEAVDLQKYHGLRVTLDVRAQEDVLPNGTRSHSPRNRQ